MASLGGSEIGTPNSAGGGLRGHVVHGVKEFRRRAAWGLPCFRGKRCVSGSGFSDHRLRKTTEDLDRPTRSPLWHGAVGPNATSADRSQVVRRGGRTAFGSSCYQLAPLANSENQAMSTRPPTIHAADVHRRAA